MISTKHTFGNKTLIDNFYIHCQVMKARCNNTFSSMWSICCLLVKYISITQHSKYMQFLKTLFSFHAIQGKKSNKKKMGKTTLANFMLWYKTKNSLINDDQHTWFDDEATVVKRPPSTGVVDEYDEYWIWPWGEVWSWFRADDASWKQLLKQSLERAPNFVTFEFHVMTQCGVKFIARPKFLTTKDMWNMWLARYEILIFEKPF